MRYIIIFGVTLIISILIIVYPRNYLKIYKDSVTIDYTTIKNADEGSWEYELSNDNLQLDKESNKVWKFTPNKNGEVKLIYKYLIGEESKYKIEYKFKVKNNKIYWLDGKGTGMFDFPNPI